MLKQVMFRKARAVRPFKCYLLHGNLQERKQTQKRLFTITSRGFKHRNDYLLSFPEDSWGQFRAWQYTAFFKAYLVTILKALQSSAV
jgi:hypothetical protein